MVTVALHRLKVTRKTARLVCHSFNVSPLLTVRILCLYPSGTVDIIVYWSEHTVTCTEML